MKKQLFSIVIVAFCLISCHTKYDESMTYAKYAPIPNMLPNMDVAWSTETGFKDLAIVKATVQNDLQNNVINYGVGPQCGKIVVSVQEISDSLGVAGILWGLLDMYCHTMFGIPFCARHVHVALTFNIYNQNNEIIARYLYRGYQKRYLAIYYSKDSQTAIVLATRNALSEFHRDVNRDMQSLIAQLQPEGKKKKVIIEQQEEPVMSQSDVDINIPKSNTSNPNTFVVIYANEDYKRVGKVPFAKQDGQIFAEYCKTTLGVPEKNIHLVENATLNDMRSEIYWLSQICDAFNGDAKVIVYYSGHGIPDESEKTSYILPVDGDGNHVNSGYKLNDFYEDLGKMPAKMICVFMDACFSGMRKDGEALVPARGVALKAKSGVPQGNMVVFSAAQGDETAYPYTDKQHGLLTYYLLKKLQESKGDVTLQELGSYITNNVRKKSLVENNKPQTPCISPSSAVADTWQTWKLK